MPVEVSLALEERIAMQGILIHTSSDCADAILWVL